MLSPARSSHSQPEPMNDAPAAACHDTPLLPENPPSHNPIWFWAGNKRNRILSYRWHRPLAPSSRGVFASSHRPPVMGLLGSREPGAAARPSVRARVCRLQRRNRRRLRYENVSGKGPAVTQSGPSPRHPGWTRRSALEAWTHSEIRERPKSSHLKWFEFKVCKNTLLWK